MPTLHVRLLGDFSLVYEDEQVTGINAARLQSLLAYLILHRHAPQSREQLAFQFWPDSNETQALNNLRKALHHLRRHLPAADVFVHADAKTVRWLPDAPFTLDVLAFEQALASAQVCRERDDVPGLRDHLTRAIAIYLGDLLPGCYDDWVAPQREHLRDRLMTALAQLTALLEEQGDIAAAIQFANQRVRCDPLSEVAYRHLMQLHMANGDTGSALRSYHACVTSLQRELNVAPGALTRQVYERLPHVSEALPEPPESLPVSAPLIGRGDDLTRLQRILAEVMRGNPRCAVISGEAGIGKTRLIEAFYAWTAQRDFAAAYTRAYAAEGALAYAPIAAWLRTAAFKPRWGRLARPWLTELARILPELTVERPDLPAPRPMAESWQRKQLFEALARAVQACGRPLILALDDAQWCDRDTLEWLHFFLRFDPAMPLLVILGVQLGEVRLDAGSDHPLAALLLDLQAQRQVTEFELGALNQTETFDLATQAAGRPLSPEALQRLHRDSLGNPLFIVEMARAQSAHVNGKGGASSSQDTVLPLPPKVQAVIRARLAQLSPPARAIANVAAIIGREFTPDVAALACRPDVTPDAFVQGLDELWQRRILREHGADGYDFSHDRIRDVALAALSPAWKRSLHLRVAQALERTYAGNLVVVSGQLAAHYEEAGAYEEAIAHYFQAARAANGLFAFEDEIALLKRGLRLFTRLPDTAERQQLRLYFLNELGMTLLLVRPGSDPEMERAFAEARTLSLPRRSDESLFRAQRGLWIYHLLRGDLLAAKDYALQNMTVAQRIGAEPVLGEAARCLAMAEWFLGNLVPANQHMERAIQHMPPDYFLAHGGVFDDTAGTDGMNAGAMILWQLGFPEQAIRQNAAGLAFNRQLRQPFCIVMVLEFSAYIYAALKQIREVHAAGVETLALAEKYEFGQYINIGRVITGWATAALGQPAEGLPMLRSGIAGCLASDMHCMLTLYYALLAQVHGWLGQHQQAYAVLEGALALARRNHEYFWLAELHRLMGDCLLTLDHPYDAVETCYREALDVALSQSVRSFELRAATSLARLWQRQNKLREAHTLLSQTYAWFTEGFDTADLIEARALLDQMAPTDPKGLKDL